MYIVNELNEVEQNTTENYEQRPCWFDLKRENIIGAIIIYIKTPDSGRFNILRHFCCRDKRSLQQ